MRKLLNRGLLAIIVILSSTCGGVVVNAESIDDDVDSVIDIKNDETINVGTDLSDSNEKYEEQIFVENTELIAEEVNQEELSEADISTTNEDVVANTNASVDLSVTQDTLDLNDNLSETNNNIDLAAITSGEYVIGESGDYLIYTTDVNDTKNHKFIIKENCDVNLTITASFDNGDDDCIYIEGSKVNLIFTTGNDEVNIGNIAFNGELTVTFPRTQGYTTPRTIKDIYDIDKNNTNVLNIRDTEGTFSSYGCSIEDISLGDHSLISVDIGTIRLKSMRAAKIIIDSGRIEINNTMYDSFGPAIGGALNKKDCELIINSAALYTEATNGYPAIGNDENSGFSKIEINGGYVSAHGGSNAAGIGSSANNDIDTEIIINGGTVFAVGGSNAAGIGSGNSSRLINIIVNGGIIGATGGVNGAAIGGGNNSNCNVTINNGNITTNLKGQENPLSYSIGSNGDNSTVTINGGTINSSFDIKATNLFINNGSVKSGSINNAKKGNVQNNEDTYLLVLDNLPYYDGYDNNIKKSVDEIYIDDNVYTRDGNNISIIDHQNFGNTYFEDSSFYAFVSGEDHTISYIGLDGVKVTLDVKWDDENKTFDLYYKDESSISFKEEKMFKDYDGTPASIDLDQLSIQGSKGTITFEWYIWENGIYKLITEIPTLPGQYFVRAILSEDDNYKGAYSELVQYSINKIEFDPYPIFDFAFNTTFEATYGQKLSDIKLPDGYHWENPNDFVSINNQLGEFSHAAYYEADSSIYFDPITYIHLKVLVSKGSPIFTIPNDLTATYGQKLKDIELPIGFKWKNSQLSVGNVGVNTFNAIYTDANTELYDPVEVEIQVTVNKANPEYTVPTNLSAKYGDKLSDISLPSGFEWIDATTVVGNANNTYSYKARYVPNDTNNFETIELELQVTVIKAIPSYTVPTDLEATYGNVLSDVDLGEGFSWDDPDLSVGNVGEHRFTATYIPDDINNYEVVRNIEIKIRVNQAENSWLETLTITGWTYEEYDSFRNSPNAVSKYGTVEFVYSDSEQGIFTSEIPQNAGTYYVKATVTETNNFSGLEAIVQFAIDKKTYTIVETPSNISAIVGDSLHDIELPNGWEWENENEIIIPEKTEYSAIYEVDYLNNDYSQVEGYDAENHLIRRTLTISISKKENTWIEELSIEGWEYLDAPNDPKAESMYGNVVFTYSSDINGEYSSSVPSTIGTWYVKASVEATNEYTGLNKIVSFTISKRTNMLTSDLTLEDWIFGDNPNEPMATVEQGKPMFLYASSINGVYSMTIPTEVGTYFVKVVVEESDTYRFFESNPISFVIKAKDLENIVEIPEINKDTDLSNLVLMDGDKRLVLNQDYVIKKSNVGENVTVIISFINNYSGSLVFTYFDESLKETENKTEFVQSWDDGGPFTTDACGSVYDRWGNKLYDAGACDIDSNNSYQLVNTSDN